MNKKLFFLTFVLILIGLPFCLGIEFNGSVHLSEGLNTSVSVNETIYYDSVDINESYIFYSNYNYTLGSEYIRGNINITTSNARYYHNSSHKDMPYISSSTNNEKILSSNFPINATFKTSKSCNAKDSINAWSCSNNCNMASFSCTNDLVVFELEIASGTTVLTHSVYAEACSDLELEFIDQFVTIAELIAILILVAIIAVPIIGLYMGWIEFEQLISVGALIILIIAIVISAMAVLIISNMSTLFC